MFYWLFIPFGAVFCLVLMVGAHQDSEHPSLAVWVATVGMGSLIVLCGYVEIRKHRLLPYRVTISEQGLKGEFLLQEPVFMPWDSIVLVSQEHPAGKNHPASYLVKIESHASTYITVHSHIRGYEMLASEMAERGLAPKWLSEEIEINGHDVPSLYSKPKLVWFTVRYFFWRESPQYLWCLWVWSSS